MIYLVFIVVLFFVAPFVVGVLANYSDVNKIRSLSKRYRKHRVYWFFGISVWVSVSYILFCFYFLESFGFWFYIALSASSVSAIVLVSKEFRLLYFFKSYPKLSGTVGGFVFFGVTVLAKVFVDAEITGMTGVDAKNFPNAQQLVLFLVAPIFWFLFILLAILPIYFFYAVWLVLKGIDQRNSFLGKFYRVVSIVFDVKLGARESSPFLDMACILGMVVLLALAPKFVLGYPVSKDYRNNLEELLIFSSYVSPKGHCSNFDDDYFVSFLDNDRVSVMKKGEGGGYINSIGICDRTLPN